MGVIVFIGYNSLFSLSFLSSELHLAGTIIYNIQGGWVHKVMFYADAWFGVLQPIILYVLFVMLRILVFEVLTFFRVCVCVQIESVLGCYQGGSRPSIWGYQDKARGWYVKKMKHYNTWKVPDVTTLLI